LSVRAVNGSIFHATISYEVGSDECMTHTTVFSNESHKISEIIEQFSDDPLAMKVVRLISLLFMFTDPSIDLMERIVLKRDENKKITQAILDRAKRRNGKGWSIGRKLDSLPRKSRPHWGIRWCKPNHDGEVIKEWDGATPNSRQGCVPKLRPIRGANEDFYRKIPTGYQSNANQEDSR
jgi:hypothetical protein